MTSKPFKGLLISQFFGAFNDNAWKMLVIFLGGHVISQNSTLHFESTFQTHFTKANLFFILPFILASVPACFIADKISKRNLIIYSKIIELVLMFAGLTILYFDPFNLAILLLVLSFMGIQSAFFSPAKYGIIPEIIPTKELSRANGWLEMWTMLAIIFGMGSLGWLKDSLINQIWLIGIFLSSFSIIGLIASYFIPSIPAADPNGGLKITWQAISALRKEHINHTIISLMLVWAVASMATQNMIVYIKSTLNLPDTMASICQALCGLAVAIGSLIAGKMSKERIEMSLFSIGIILLASSCGIFGMSSPNYNYVCALMFVFGLGGGLALVPLNAWLQWKAPHSIRGSIICISNIFVFSAILAGSIIVGTCAKLGWSAQEIFIFTSILAIVTSLWIFIKWPQTWVNLLPVVLARLFYRINSTGLKNIPTQGGALLVCNHVSFVDWLLLMASCPRQIHFVIDNVFYEHPIAKPFLKIGQAIPISTTGEPKKILRGLRAAGKHLDEGQVVCIFAEGQITRTGALQPFRRGLEQILKGRNHPIIPVYLDRVWGSLFSFERERFITKVPRQVPYPVTVAYGPPLPSNTRVVEIRKAVQNLSQEAWAQRKKDHKPLHHKFIQICRRHPFEKFLMDKSSKPQKRLKSLVSTIVLARKLSKKWSDQNTIGLLLPASLMGTLLNLATSISGCVSVNLNYTLGQDAFDSSLQQSELKTIVTSRKFFQRINLKVPNDVAIIWIEDALQEIKSLELLFAGFLAMGSPISWIEKYCGSTQTLDPDSTATIIFTSGSTGEPKGVQLTHFNIDANIQALSQIFKTSKKDRILGALPLFHSFGLFISWYASNQNLGLVCHHDPRDATAVGELVDEHHVSILLAAPTFLKMYLKRCTPEQFKHLRVVLTGAEKLSDRLSNDFEKKFKIRPLEGYGMTECSPVVAISVPDYKDNGFYQYGSRQGCVGQPLPGVAMRVVNPETFEDLPTDEAGMLLVKGPNVMKGYLNRKDLTDKVIQEGWYVTGDIVQIDNDGFIKITDRISRFSKIGGEMIPHGKIEEALHAVTEQEPQTFVVTAIPDERKGEKIIVFHTYKKNIEEAIQRLKDKGLSNLMIPRSEQFFKIDTIPLLGNGKLDLAKIKLLALEKTQST